jgi:hypothetical protein
MNEQRPFFVIGYPRSRTAWLSTWLTNPPYSFCFHEALLRFPVGGFPEQFRLSGSGAFGDADSGLPLFFDEIDALFPMARYLFVHRPIKEAKESFMAATDTEKQKTDAAFTLMRQGQEKMIKKLFGHRVMHVDFHDLDDVNVARDIWGFCVPDAPFHRPRWEEMNALRITQIIPKAVARANIAHMEKALKKGEK